MLGFAASVSYRAAKLSQTGRVRALAATLLVLGHLLAMTLFARTHYGLPFNASPSAAPAFAHPATDQRMPRWNRLLSSRWDSEHYLNLAARGYRYCPAEDMRAHKRVSTGMECDLSFYPGYPALGYLASLGGLVPIDLAMLAVTLACSWIFLFLWTGPEVTSALGVEATWMSLLVFNAFTNGFFLVSIHTEPMLFACTLGAAVLLARDRPWAAALAAGLGTSARISGAGLAVGFAAAMVVKTWRERPVLPRELAKRAAMVALSGWGQLAIFAYHGLVLGDPLLYVHSYQRGYALRPSLGDLLLPNPTWLARSVDSNLHEGIWTFAAFLFLCLGGRRVLRGFSPELRAFWISVSAVAIFISWTGTVTRQFAGMPRYLMAAVPIFFAAGKVFERRALALSLWLAVSFAHYWSYELCLYVGDRGPSTWRVCHFVKCEEPR